MPPASRTNRLAQANSFRCGLFFLASVLTLAVSLQNTGLAQDASKGSSPLGKRAAGESTNGKPSLAVQLRELQTKVAKLEKALKKNQAGMMKSGMMKPGMGMASMAGKGMKGDKKSMASMGMAGMGNKTGMGKKAGMAAMAGGQKMGGKKMAGMAMMGRMKGMGKMKMPSALPGFAGASHIYHIGADSFFLDHAEHITLTQEQQIKLNQIKEKVLLGQATSDRWIEQAEQELWVLTSSDRPQAAQVEAKIREIEKLNGDKRIAYIRAVGQAAGVLTKEQRQTLVGNLPPEHTAENASSEN